MPAVLLATLLLAATPAQGGDRGTAYPSASEASDNKLGSLLIYNVVSSSTASPASRNTELSLTNHHETQSTTVRLFFVEGATGAVSRSLPIVLAPNQVVSMLTAEVAPSLEGYAIAVAYDGATGCPHAFNHLSGSAAVKLDSGHRADLAAEAVAALYTGSIAGCSAVSTTATLELDGTQYNRVAATVAGDSFGASADGNSGLLVLNRIGGDLTASAGRQDIGYDALASGGASAGSGFVNNGNPQLRLTTESLLQVPPGETAWVTVTAGGGVAGALLNFNANAGAAAGAFNGGHNLHRLALGDDSLVVPVLPATPGFQYPAASEASDNRAGSVLIFPLFTAGATASSENAELTLTNTHDAIVDVRLFFVSGASGAIVIDPPPVRTLLPHATISLRANDVLPGFRGYVIAVAIDVSLCPIAFNHLIGDVDVKLATGHFASLPATAVAALYTGSLGSCGAGDASLRFDGVDYNRLPRGLALDHAGSTDDGNFTVFALDHVGGDLDAALTPIGAIDGNAYDDSGTASAFEFSAPPQFFGTFDPGVPSGVPAWFEAYPAEDAAMVGIALRFNANAGSMASGFNGGHNLHVLTLGTDILALGDPPVSTPTARPTGSPSPTPPSGTCVGDCNGDGTVTINELIIGVNILLGSQPLASCPAFDRNDSGSITIDELIQGVSNLLGGCPM